MVTSGSIHIVLGAILTLLLHDAATEHFSILSDLHYDPTYWTAREGCRDAALTEPPTTYGMFDCEPSWELVANAVHNMAVKGSGTKFVIWLGDNSHHWSHTLSNPTILTSEVMFEILQNVTDLLQNAVGSNTQVLPVLGNHDWIPKSALPSSTDPGYERLASMWDHWLAAAEDQTTFTQGGYYSLLVDDTMKTRAVVLNGNLYLTYNDAVSGEEADPAGQFAWLKETLQQARDNEERVLLISHVPIGMSDDSEDRSYMNTTANARLTRYIRDYWDVITAIIAGHAHTDSFRLIYDANIPVAYQLNVPAVSPLRNSDPKPMRARNPGLRIVKYDYMSGKLTDYDQYYLDISKVAEKGTVNPTWDREYSLLEAYGLQDLTASDLHDLLFKKFNSYGSPEFSKYYQYNTVSVPGEEYQPCGARCKTGYLCAIEHIEPEDYRECMEQVNGASTPALSYTLASLGLLLCLFQG